jgi:PAS domain S-box-containing protein
MVSLQTGQKVKDVVMGVYNPREKRYRWINISAVPLFRSGEDKPFQVYTLFEDITERKQAKDALRKSEEQLLLAQQVAKIGTFELNIETGVNIWTPELETMYGLQPGEFGKTLKDWEQLVYADDRPKAMRLVEKAFQTNEPVEGEWRVIWPDGSIHWLTGRWQVLDDASGKPSRMIGMNIDITERKEAETKLEETLENLENLVKERTVELEKAYSKLKESEKGLAEAQRIAHIGNWDWNFISNEIHASHETYRILGYNPKELKPTYDILLNHVHPNDRDYVDDAIKQALKGKPLNIDFRIVSADSIESIVNEQAEIVLDEKNNPVQMRGTIQDITERKKAEDALRASEARYRSLYENSLDGILLTKPDGTVLSANPQACSLFGMTEDEIIKTGRDGIVVQDEKLAFALEDRDRTGRMKAKLTFRRKDGSTFVGEASSGLFADSDGISKSSLIIRDITERQQAEERIRDLANVVESSNDAIITRSIDGIITSWNKGAEQIYGYSAEEILGKNVTSLIPPSFNNETEALSEIIEKGEKVQHYETLRLRKDGTIINVSISVSPVFSTCGKITAISVIARDITKRKKAEEALHDSETRLRAYLDNSAIIAWMKDEKGRYTFMSSNCEKRFGVGFEDWHGKTDFDLWPREIAEKFCENDLAVLKSGKNIEIVEEVRNPDGSISFMWNNKFLFVDSLGKKYVGGLGVDITELKKAEEALRESEERFNLAAKAAQEGVWDWNLETDEVWYSPRYKEMLGYSEDEIEHHVNSWLRLLHPDDKERSLKIVDAVMRGERNYELEFRFRHKDGHYLNILSRGYPVRRESDGKIVRIVGTHFDLTDRKKAEEDLLKGKEQYQALFNSISEGFANCKAIYDEHGTLCDLLILDINPAGARISGSEREVQIGKTMREVGPDVEDYWFEAYQKVDQTGKSIQFESFGGMPGKWLNVRIDRIEKGQFAVVFRDITKEKEAKEALAKYEIARKKEIHHRIKNNLQIISALLELQAEKLKDKTNISNSEMLHAFKESQDRVLSMALIHEELYRGGETDKLNFSSYIGKLAENLILTYRVDNKDISLDMDMEENTFFDTDTAIPLGMIINELVSNSFKYAFQGRDKGEIKIRLLKDKNIESKNEAYVGNTYILSVSDNGIGIPENLDIENLDSLGLQLVTTLVDQIDGELELKRINGTEFTVKFPETEKE